MRRIGQPGVGPGGLARGQVAGQLLQLDLRFGREQAVNDFPAARWLAGASEYDQTGSARRG